ncbi:MAG: hypothetical protein IJ217_05775 [Clostridia bacterium]|nr:hypothetical protein [Clostridia bacterium]
MDNFQKALQMAAAAFMFVIAATVTIRLYSSLIQNTERIIVASDINNMASEYAIMEDRDYTRKIKKDEIIMTVLDIENNRSYLDSVEIIASNGSSFTFTVAGEGEYVDGNISRNTQKELNSWLAMDRDKASTYTASYDDRTKTLVYTYNQ